MGRGGAREKLRKYFLKNVGRVLGSDELREVAGISEWARRVRELRSESGYKILTHNDREELKPGEYLLEDPVPQDIVFERAISKETRAVVLDRNGFTCQMCGVGAGEVHPFDGRKVRLHIGHIIDKSEGGDDSPGNLRTLCSVCNEGASNVTQSRPSSLKLLSQLRRAKVADQKVVLEWLIEKFPSEAEKLIGKE